MKPRRFGTKKPKTSKRSKIIRKAVKRAVNEYKETYKRLAYE